MRAEKIVALTAQVWAMSEVGLLSLKVVGRTFLGIIPKNCMYLFVVHITFHFGYWRRQDFDVDEPLWAAVCSYSLKVLRWSFIGSILHNLLGKAIWDTDLKKKKYSSQLMAPL